MAARWSGVAAKLLLWLLVLSGIGWGALALWFDGPANRGLAGSLATSFG